MSEEDSKNKIGFAIGEVASVLLFKKWQADYRSTNGEELDD